MRDLHRLLRPGNDALLIGVDLKKDPRRLHAAYNDAQGVTAEFNLNLLHRIRRELDSDIVPALFAHRAFYNARLGRIEMHLVSRAAHSLRVEGETFTFQAGETIHTENSYKYHVTEFQALAAAAGFTPETVWTDPDDLFSIHFLRA